MRGGVSGSSSMLALKRREHSFHNTGSTPQQQQHQQQKTPATAAAGQPTLQRPHSISMPVAQLHKTPRTPGARVGMGIGAAIAPRSPESSGSNSSIASGIHVFNAPSRAGVGSARRLPQFTMQPTPRSRGTGAQLQRTPVRARASPGFGRASFPAATLPSGARHQPAPHSNRKSSLHAQHISQQQRVPASKRPKKLLSSVMSATNFYSSAAPPTTEGPHERDDTAHMAQDAQPLKQRPVTFTFGSAVNGVPRAMATLPSPGGSPDPIDAFSSPIPFRPLQALTAQVQDAEQDHLLEIFADLQKTAQGGRATEAAQKGETARRKSQKRPLAQLFESDEGESDEGESDSDDEPILKPGGAEVAYMRAKQSTAAAPAPSQAHTSAALPKTGKTEPNIQGQRPDPEKENDASRYQERGNAAAAGGKSRKRQRQERDASAAQQRRPMSDEEARHEATQTSKACTPSGAVEAGPSTEAKKAASSSSGSSKTLLPPAKKAKKNPASASGEKAMKRKAERREEAASSTVPHGKDGASEKRSSKQKVADDGKDQAAPEQPPPPPKEKRGRPPKSTSQSTAKDAPTTASKSTADPGPSTALLPTHTSSRPQRNVARKQIIELTDDEDEFDDKEPEDDDKFGEGEDEDAPPAAASKSAPRTKPKKNKTPSPAAPQQTEQRPKRKNAKEQKRADRDADKEESENDEDEWEGPAASNPILQLLEDDVEESGMYAERVQQRLGTGKAKGVDSRSPARRLMDLMADIFDAEDGLPPSATVGSDKGMCAESALIFTPLQGNFVLRMDVLHSLVRLIKLCKSTPVAPVAAAGGSRSGQALSSDPAADAHGDGAAVSTDAPEPKTVAEMDQTELSRLLRVLERTARAAEGTRPFTGTTSGSNISTTDSSSDDVPTSETDPASDDTTQEAASAVKGRDGSVQYFDLSQRIERIAAGVLAAECCFEIFSLEKLPEILISEDVLQSCLDALKMAVNETILPFVEGCADIKTTTTQPLLRHFLQNLIPAPLKKKRGRPSSKAKALADAKGMTAITACGDQVTSVFVRTYAALGSLHALVNAPSIQFSESAIISVVYVAVGPFFALEPEENGASKGNKSGATAKEKKAGARTAIDAVGGASAMRSLRLPALHLLRSIFALHPEQRSWIIEEVLGSLGKLAGSSKTTRQIALRSGGSVNFITTLLLHLVQSSAHGFREHVLSKEPLDAASGSSPVKSPESTRSGGSRKRKRSESPDKGKGRTRTRDVAQAAMWSMSMEGPLQTASTIAAFVMQRVTASKASKSTNDVAYIAVVESLMLDLFEMLFLPEWPGAGILLTRFCIAFISVLNDPHSGPEARGIAIDQLGAAATRLRTSQLQLGGSGPSGSGPASKPLRLLRDIIGEDGELNAAALEHLQVLYVNLRNSLGRITDEDRAADSARELLEAQWIAETAAAMTKMNDDQGVSSAEEQQALEALVEELKVAPKKVGKDLPRSDEITPTQYKQLIRTSHYVLSSSAFMVQYDTLQSHLLDALERQAVANRAKALRALSSIAVVDLELLVNEDVRWAVEARLEDASVGVREAAVGLLSRYILQRPSQIDLHFEQLVHHLYDSGVSVRKRIIRLLADIYTTVTDKRLQAECCARLIRCVTDEDTGIQDLAVATIAKLWFDVSLRASESKKGKLVSTVDGEDGALKRSGSPNVGKSAHIPHSDVITIVASLIRERPSPMEEVFLRMLQQCSEQDAAKLRTSYRELSDTMIDAIVSEPASASQSPDPAGSEHDPSSIFSRVRTIHLLVSTLPTVLTVNRGKALLPFLKSAQTETEIQVLHLLLRVFSAALPSMPRTAIAFAQELERSLMPLINRPRFKSGSTALQELVGCYVKVIKLHTHNFSLMLKMFIQCYGRLQFVADHVTVTPKLQLEATNAILISLTTLLCEHADFDKLKQTHPSLAPTINNINKDSVLEGVYTMLVTIYQSEDPGYKAAALQNLGYLFRSYPSLMGRDDATRTMDEVLAQGDAYQRELLLRSLLEFLNGQQQTRSEELAASKQARAKNTENAPVDMAQLVGDTAEFAESSVSPALLQRYLDRILDASLSVRIPGLQRTALEILKITVLQGLTHPLQCVPTLIALETSADESIRSAAFHMHSHLALKHGSILAARYLEHARVAFSFQLSIKGADQVRGLHMEDRPTAALSQWYSLVAEKRQTKLDFLKALIKAFDVGRLEAACTREDVAFARFLADNLALFEYTTNEEVMTIISELRTILSVAGMQTYSAIDDELEEREAELQKLSQPAQKKAPEMWIEIEATNTRPKRGIGATSNRPAGQTTTQASDKILDKARELELARTSTILSFALVLRNQLKWLYTLSEARCAKFVPGKKSSAGADKPVVRRSLATPNAAVLELGSFPGAFCSCEQSRDALLQMQAFHNAIAEEGSILEADEDDNYE